MKRGKKVLAFIGAVLLVAGALVLLWPVIGNMLNDSVMHQQIEDYNEEIAQIQRAPSSSGSVTVQKQTPPDLARLLKDMQAYNKRIFEDGQKDLKDPFSYEQQSFDLSQYGLHRMFGYLEIPKMNLSVPIYLGASKKNLRDGVAQMTQTSVPIGGVNTNCVIAGHRGMGAKAMFRDIEKLKIGDEVTVVNPWGKLIYKVSKIQIITPTDVQAVLIQPDKDMLTLLTCHPYRHNYQRYLVYCERAA